MRVIASLATLLIVSPTWAATIYMGGFELGTAGVAGGDYAVAGSITVVTSPVHSGNYAGKIGAVNTHLVSSGFGVGNSIFSVSTISCRAYIQFLGSPPAASASGTFEFTSGSTLGMRATMVDTGGGNFRMAISSSGAGFSTTTGTVPLSGNTWYRMDFIYDRAAGGVGQIYINGVLDVNTTHTGLNGLVDRMSIVGNGTVGNEHVFDDIFCTDTLTVGPDGKLITRQGKAGTPTDAAFTLTSCATIDECWSETPVGTVKIAASASTTAAAAQTMLQHDYSTTQTGHGSEVLVGNETINGVQILCQAATSSTSSGGTAGNIRKYVSGVGPTDTAVVLTAAYLVHKSAVFTDTVANLDLYQIGWKKDASAAARVHTVADCWMNVDYLASTGIQRKVIQD
jgi:Concanavalin A-like lectin/glucanases superfamily